ncbi:hypothetical protein SORBI_3008G088809 [Sorghum bicolor]|uniref:RING-type domain-containing protein n=1 Tax=Sorghum bicolor TaxID=4558 RepID=A0A1Z5R6D9_SORBI|nr:hypothetical protein SORBI_3008G088809 [Sorghum bicolor]
MASWWRSAWWMGRASRRSTADLATVAGGVAMKQRKCLSMCPVCLSKPRDMAFGCGHQTCSECGPQVADCPICRRPIDTRVKLY